MFFCSIQSLLQLNKIASRYNFKLGTFRPPLEVSSTRVILLILVFSPAQINLKIFLCHSSHIFFPFTIGMLWRRNITLGNKLILITEILPKKESLNLFQDIMSFSSFRQSFLKLFLNKSIFLAETSIPKYLVLLTISHFVIFKINSWFLDVIFLQINLDFFSFR